jgi:hypothetical protein
MMMDVLRAALGEERILGNKFQRKTIDQSIENNSWNDLRDWMISPKNRLKRDCLGKKREAYELEFSEFDVDSETFVDDIMELEDFNERIHLIYGVWFKFID